MKSWSDNTFLVTGASGFVGKSVLDKLKKKNPKKIFTPTSSDFNLTKENDVKKLFENTNPDVVIHLAGKVGGIGANAIANGEFFYKNIMMGTLVLEYARLSKVKKLVGLAAGCGYPKYLEVPFKENDFWSDLPDENSIGYSMAKKMLIIQSWSYRQQYNFDSTILLPANLYGPHDNFDLETSHVVPALIRKFFEAKKFNSDLIEIWGTGVASREFLYVEDTADAILKSVEINGGSGPFNLGTGNSTSIKELVQELTKISNFQGTIEWDTSKPDGQPNRYYDMTNFENTFGYLPSTTLNEGLKKTYTWFEKNYKN